MKIEYKTAFEFLGIFGIIASLIFVGMQLSLDRNVAQADQYFNRSESRKADLRSMMENEFYLEEYARRWSEGSRPRWWNEENQINFEENGSDARGVRVSILEVHINFIHLDGIYYQYRAGLLDENIWNTALESIRTSLRNPFERNIYLNAGLDLPLRRLVIEIANET